MSNYSPVKELRKRADSYLQAQDTPADEHARLRCECGHLEWRLTTEFSCGGGLPKTVRQAKTRRNPTNIIKTEAPAVNCNGGLGVIGERANNQAVPDLPAGAAYRFVSGNCSTTIGSFSSLGVESQKRFDMQPNTPVEPPGNASASPRSARTGC